MTLENLDNLVKVKQLKAEPPDQQEFDGMVSSARLRLKDSKLEGLSDDSRFSLAYGAAHALALAALVTAMPASNTAGSICAFTVPAALTLSWLERRRRRRS